MKFLIKTNTQTMKKIFLGLALAGLLVGCSTSKIHKIEVPTDKAIVFEDPIVEGAAASDEAIQKWPHKDITSDAVPGMSINKAYEFLSDKKATTITVAVIDSGIDIEHEDLKDNIWTNSGEIAGDGIDNDKNGYVDDIHGWNFFGGKDGQNIPEQLEITRIYKKLKDKYEGKSTDKLSKKELKEYVYYLEVKSDFEARSKEATENLEYFKMSKEALLGADHFLQEKTGKKVYTVEDIKALPPQEQVPEIMNVLASGRTIEAALARLDRAISHYDESVNVNYNLDFKGRVAGDDPYDIKDKDYGNAFVRGSLTEESHGTHVSGIIMATRNNGIGVDGAAANVKLMSVRAVPNGDEYDKDVALAIRYAVDNGAKVINMSFGKSYSTNPEWVYDAIKYAAKHDVLLVHAAGNDSKNLATAENYPTDAPDKLNEIADNVLTIGSSTRHFDENLVSSFSNYGQNNVDIFAPGSEIYSTVPNSEYQMMQGTSMASPAVAGVAALIRAYYPELSASQVKHIIMNTGVKADFDVLLPGGKGKKVPFSKLSVSGSIINAYNALKLAETMTNTNSL